MKTNIGILGLGTVGSGVFKTLKNFEDITVKKIAVRNLSKNRNIEGLDDSILTDNPYDVVNDNDIDIVVELIGGVEPTWDYIKTALENGKHIVTANKELLAKKGEELFNLAEEKNRVVLYEAAIGGGVPLIMPMKTILKGNKIQKIQAIINGTTNYILTNMDVNKLSYESVLKEAQELGYAEADPTGDVEGFDAAYKITTLSTIAFGKRIKLDKVYREGITKVRPEDMAMAEELGYKIKLIAMGQITEDGKADVRVHPMLVPQKSTLAHIDYVTNAVNIVGHPIGDILLSGPGAGEFPTASSVVGDILAITAELGTTDYLLPMMRCNHSASAEMVDISETYNRYYVSITTPNSIGVIAKIGNACASYNISLSSLLQKGLSENNTADITIITEKCKETDIKSAINSLEGCTINSFIRVGE